MGYSFSGKALFYQKNPHLTRTPFERLYKAAASLHYVRPDIVDIWMGDSPQRLVGKVYTHFPDDFMYEQMQSVKFPLPITA